MNRDDANGRRNGVMWMGIALAAFVRLAGGAGADLHAETSAPQELRFEVVSVKRNTSGAAGSMMGIQPEGRFAAGNLAVRQVIVRARSGSSHFSSPANPTGCGANGTTSRPRRRMAPPS